MIAIVALCSATTRNEELFKTWKFKKINPNDSRELIFEVADDLNHEGPGYVFYRNGKLKVKQSRGWCPSGETQIEYQIVEGRWKMVNDTVVELIHKKYDSEFQERKIISKVDDQELILKSNRRYK